MITKNLFYGLFSLMLAVMGAASMQNNDNLLQQEIRTYTSVLYRENPTKEEVSHSIKNLKNLKKSSKEEIAQNIRNLKNLKNLQKGSKKEISQRIKSLKKLKKSSKEEISQSIKSLKLLKETLEMDTNHSQDSTNEDSANEESINEWLNQFPTIMSFDTYSSTTQSNYTYNSKWNN